MNDYSGSHIRIWTVEAIAAALRRQSRVLWTCFAALAVGAVAAVLTAPPLYEGRLKLLVKRDRADAVVSGVADPAAVHVDRELSEAEMLSQIELMKSQELLEQVADASGLVKALHAQAPHLADAEARERAAHRLAERLQIAPVRRTHLIDVRYEADDRASTRRVLDSLTRLYLEKHLALQRPPGTFDFFAEQAQQARRELDALRQRAAQFAAQHQVVSASLEKQAVLQTLSEFDAMRAEAAAQLAQSTRRLAAVSTQLRQVPEQRTSSTRTDTRVVADVKARLLTLEMTRTELMQKFTPEYRGVREIDTQIREAKAALEAALRTPVREETIADNPTRQWLETELARTRAEQAALQSRVRALGSSVTQFRTRAQTLEVRDGEQQDLERELKAAEAKYLLYAQKREEARISDELDRTRIANVVVAEGPAVAMEAQRDPSLAFLPLLIGVALLLSGGTAVAVDALTPAWRRWTVAVDGRRPLVGHISPEESLS